MPSTGLDLHQVRDLFDRASDLSGGDREAVLSQADPALQVCVRGMLDSQEREHSVLDRPLVVENEPLYLPGERAGRYRILREIGHGGMGSVYLAQWADRDPSPRFALKIVRFPSAELARRLMAEAAILSRLEHPNIARLVDAGVTPSGLPFLAMEYVEGRSITQHCADSRSTPKDVAALVRQVCAAVGYLHGNLVVHRDLKPANILVTAEGLVKVVDFGIAKALEPAPSSTAEALGAAAETIGAMTPSYASPEQICGEAISTQTDVFTLGVVLYELLSGTKPFPGNPVEVLRRVCEEDPPPLDPSTPADLASIAGMAMRKEPARRYPSIERLDEDLRRFLEGHPVHARGNSRWYRASKFVRRHKAALSAGLAVAAALTIGLALAERQSRLARAERVKAEQQTQTAIQQRGRAERSEAQAQSLAAQARSIAAQAELNARTAERGREQAQRRLDELVKLARGAARTYGNAIDAGETPAPGLAEHARDSMLALGREGVLDPVDQRVLDQASAELRSRELAADTTWEIPRGWSGDASSESDYRIGVDRVFLYQGKPSIFIRSLVAQPQGAAIVAQEFSAERYRGKRVELSAMLRSERIEQQGVLTLRVRGGENGSRAQAAHVRSTQTWSQYAVRMDVDPDAEFIHIGLTLVGTGTIWASQVDFREVSRSFPLTQPVGPSNLDFSRGNLTKERN